MVIEKYSLIPDLIHPVLSARSELWGLGEKTLGYPIMFFLVA